MSSAAIARIPARCISRPLAALCLVGLYWHPIVGRRRRAIAWPGSGTEALMAYTLQQFCADHHALLTSGQPLAQALPQIAEKLSKLLRNPEFVAVCFCVVLS